jgi:hypothetical protein
MFAMVCCLYVHAQSEQTGAANGPMTMTGCIAEKNGKYMMMTKNHPEGIQLVGSQDMSSQVGHRVSATGMMRRMDHPASEAMSSNKDAAPTMEMRVTSMKMMSEQCDASE